MPKICNTLTEESSLLGPQTSTTSLLR